MASARARGQAVEQPLGVRALAQGGCCSGRKVQHLCKAALCVPACACAGYLQQQEFAQSGAQAPGGESPQARALGPGIGLDSTQAGGPGQDQDQDQGQQQRLLLSSRSSACAWTATISGSLDEADEGAVDSTLAAALGASRSRLHREEEPRGGGLGSGLERSAQAGDGAGALATLKDTVWAVVGGRADPSALDAAAERLRGRLRKEERA